jgi:hypothetical protein
MCPVNKRVIEQELDLVVAGIGQGLRFIRVQYLEGGEWPVGQPTALAPTSSDRRAASN